MLENFIYAKRKSLFEEALNNGEVLDEAIVFIEDTKEIWNHGTYFDGSTFDSSNIEQSIQNISNTIADYATVRSNASTAVQPDVIADMETKTEAAATYQPIGDYATKSELPTKVSQLENDANYIQDDVYNGVYAVDANGKLINYNSADATAIGVALVAGEHKFMIAKADATDGTNTTLYWGQTLFGRDVAGVVTNGKVDGTNDYGYLAGTSKPQLNKDFTTWTVGALSEFNGKANTAAIIAGYTEHGVSMNTRDMCSVLNTFNQTEQTAGRSADWYVPACGQLALMYLNMTEINAALANIGGTALAANYYWSSSENSSASAWRVSFSGGYVGNRSRDYNCRVRFVRDISTSKLLKERVTELEDKLSQLENDVPYALKSDVEVEIEVPNGVYAVTAKGELIDYTAANESYIGVALITDNQRIMIEKMGEANTDIIKEAYGADGATNTDYKYFYWGSYGTDVAGITNISSSDAAKQDFNGKDNTAAIIATPDTDSNTEYANMGTYCAKFNEMSGTYADWYIPAAGQLYEIYTNVTDINTALTNIGGTTFNTADYYWSSSEISSKGAWCVSFSGGGQGGKGFPNRVRFVRDLSIFKSLKEKVSELESNKADKILVIDHDTNDVIFSLTPNVYHKWGVVTNLSLTLTEASEDEFNEYMFEFTSGDTATTLSVPNTIQWTNQPDILSNMTYQCSIVNNIGIFIAV